MDWRAPFFGVELVTVTLGFHCYGNFVGRPPLKSHQLSSYLLYLRLKHLPQFCKNTPLSLTQFFFPHSSFLSFFLKEFLRIYYVQVTESAVRDTNTSKINTTTTTYQCKDTNNHYNIDDHIKGKCWKLNLELSKKQKTDKKKKNIMTIL